MKPQNTQRAVVLPCWLLHLYFSVKENGFVRLLIAVPALGKSLFHPLCVPLLRPSSSSIQSLLDFLGLPNVLVEQAFPF